MDIKEQTEEAWRAKSAIAVSCNSKQKYTDVPTWVTTSAVTTQHFGIETVLILSDISRQLAPDRCNLGGGSVWDVVVPPTFWVSDSFNFE